MHFANCTNTFCNSDKYICIYLICRLLSGRLGCDGGGRQEGNGGENCQQFLKEAAAGQQQGCAKKIFLHIFIFLETEFLMRQQQQEHGNKLLHIWLGVAPDLSVNMNFAMLPKQKCIKQTIATPQCKIFHMTEGTHLARRPCF